MASVQKKGEAWYCQFLYRRKRPTFTLGKVGEAEARAVAARAEYLLMRLKQGLLQLPPGDDIVAFLQHDGKPPSSHAAAAPERLTLQQLREAYLAAFGQGAIEANTLATVKIQFTQLSQTLGEAFALVELSATELQRHIDRRRKEVTGVTIRKEIDSVRSAWNWAERTDRLRGAFPGKGLIFPKEEEKLPFMTRAEIERRIAAGGDADRLWECLYLTTAEIEALLAFVKGRKAPAWVYPMLLFAAHTGARRSEMLRARAEDVDLSGGVVTIREKKRVKGRLTTRRVPLSGTLAAELTEWLPGKICLFGAGERPLSVQAAQEALVRVLKDSRWARLKGYYVLRHSFNSALACRGVDQRLIDEWVGHQTEAMRRRYRHLTPDVQQQAIRSVFG